MSLHSAMDFNNLKQCCLSKWFLLSRTSVNRSSLVDGVFSWNIFFKFMTKIFKWIYILIIRWQSHWFYMAFLKKNFNLVCSRKKFIIVLKKITYYRTYFCRRIRKLAKISIYTTALILNQWLSVSQVILRICKNIKLNTWGIYWFSSVILMFHLF